MAFGFKRPQALKATPSQVLNWRLFWSAFVFGKLSGMDMAFGTY